MSDCRIVAYCNGCGAPAIGMQCEYCKGMFGRVPALLAKAASIDADALRVDFLYGWTIPYRGDVPPEFL